MRRLCGFVLVTGLFTCAGCFMGWMPGPAVVSDTPVPVAGKSLPPVTAEQITDSNPHQGAQLLDDELTREAQQNMLNPLPR
ncbi:MAG: hypothetical protein EXR98_06770 [Gemmataceae bacterium]|nr:hypothetical protein [Gemmataceae bacterium]